MVLRVLISTQETLYEIKGSPGGSLPLFLLADFLSVKFKLNVDLYDPIYNASDYLNYSTFKIKNAVNINDYDLIINHHFYVTFIKIFNFRYGINTKFLYNFFYFIRKVEQESPLFGTNKNSFKSFVKELNFPYVYFIDWISRWNHKVIFNEKGNIFDENLLLNKNKKVYALHIRFKSTYWKNIKGSLNDEKYNKYILNLCKNILENKNNVLWIYGSESCSFNIYQELIDLGAIDIQSIAKDPFNLSLILSNANIFISGVNGFTTYCSFLSWSKNNLDNVFVINDVETPYLKDFWVYDRYYSDLILDKQAYLNSYFYSKQIFFPKGTYNAKENIKSKFKVNNIKQKYKEQEFFIYFIDQSCNSYFGPNIDNYLIKKVCKYLSIIFSNFKFNIIKNQKDLQIFGKERIKLGQHVIMHYRLRNLSNKSKYNFPDAFRKIKGELNPSNLIFLDLFQIITIFTCKRILKHKKNIDYSIIKNNKFIEVNFIDSRKFKKLRKLIIKFKKSPKAFIYILKRYGLKFLLNKISSKKEYNKEDNNKQSLFIDKNNGNIYNERMETINLEEYVEIVKNYNNLITTNPRIFILNNFINTKKINKTEICLRDKKDLLIFKDLNMIINTYEKLSVEDLEINLPTKIL